MSYGLKILVKYNRPVCILIIYGIFSRQHRVSEQVYFNIQNTSVKPDRGVFCGDFVYSYQCFTINS